MKASKYNHFVEWNKFYFGVNVLTGCKLFLTENQFQLLSNFETTRGKLLTDDLETYDLLMTGGFIIDSTINEFEILKVIHNRSVYNSAYKMTIMPTLDCNLRCWYCYEKHIQSRMAEGIMQRVIIFVENILKSNCCRDFELDWFGGEPLIYFDEVVYPLSLKIKDLCDKYNVRFSNSVTTNGVLLNDKKILKFKEICLYNFQITVDGYKTDHDISRIGIDKIGTYDKVINNINRINILCPESHICVRVNYAIKTLANIEKMVDDINASPRISFFFEKIWQLKKQKHDDMQAQDRLCAIKDYIVKRGNIYEDRYYTYCRGHICYADIYNQIVVNYDGSLFKCTARNFADVSTSVGYLDESGSPKLNGNFYKRFQKIPFDNDLCRNCEIVPICLGACSQKMIEDPHRLQKCDSKSNKLLSLQNELYDNMFEYIQEKLG